MTERAQAECEFRKLLPKLNFRTVQVGLLNEVGASLKRGTGESFEFADWHLKVAVVLQTELFTN